MCTLIKTHLPSRWEGKECILELKNVDYQWRFTEWFASYFEYKAYQALEPFFGSNRRLKIDNTIFDYFDSLNHVWDFKTHAFNSSAGQWVILNGKESIDACVERYGGIGMVIAEGQAEYDDDLGTFKTWHNEQKGKVSKYVSERIQRGARSRVMKKAFSLERIEAIWLDSTTLQKGLSSYWMKFFLEGMRNSGGSSRRAKYMMNLEKVPYEPRLASI